MVDLYTKMCRIKFQEFFLFLLAPITILKKSYLKTFLEKNVSFFKFCNSLFSIACRFVSQQGARSCPWTTRTGRSRRPCSSSSSAAWASPPPPTSRRPSSPTPTPASSRPPPASSASPSSPAPTAPTCSPCPWSCGQSNINL